MKCVIEGRRRVVVELDKFKELEERIQSIIEEYSLVKKRNSELEALVEGTNAELEKAKSSVRVLTEQEEAIRAKVDLLLDMLHDVKVPQ
ncbi:MAG: cell division protein ZapB [Deltaproteobacteria bacterium]|nr:cell division protein ZapB [Deltaproteobacteria bacterium]MBN2844499.1 cell division protein ZapB [Deltaproteobacteria bacterium]